MMTSPIATPLETFDIRNFAESLKPAGKKGRYLCPVCNGNNLTIDDKTGKYQCWNGCECKDIREAISPWAERRGNHIYPKVVPISRSNRQSKKPQPPPIPENFNIGRLPHPVAPPETKKAGANIITKYPYSPTQWVERIDKPDGSKLVLPYHINSSGETVKGKGKEEWQPYGFTEVLKHGKGRWVLGVEGEQCCDAARTAYQILTLTFQGGSWTKKLMLEVSQQLKDAETLGVIYWSDYDDPGYKKAKNWAEAAAEVGLPFVMLDPLRIWPDCPDKGDIADFVVATNMTGDELVALFQSQIKEAFEAQIFKAEDSNFGNLPPSDGIKQTFSQIAFDALYKGNHWICASDKLYKWVGTHYEVVPDEVERRRISEFCNNYAVPKHLESGGMITTYPYASSTKVEEALKWSKSLLAVPQSSLNPPGLNCLNGVLKILWDGDKPSWELIPHSPDLYYVFPPLVEYRPDADPQHCDRLLSTLDAPQQEIFLRSIAAALDLPNVRRFKGRLVRALFLKGTGNNGKDALREAIATIFGKQPVTSATLSDFAQYDDGRRFPLANLVNSTLNWSSENTNANKLDQIQSLKAFITGNPLISEHKGKDGVEFEPKAICVFNINDVPNIQGSLEAISSRYAVLLFEKTFKVNADPSKGELEADPRFAYDPLFLRGLVCPALLNRLLVSLEKLMSEGIDYDCTQKALKDIQCENSHLFKFLQDSGLSYDPNGCLSALEIWQRLEQWYQDTGTLTYEESSTGKRKAIWSDQARHSDRNVKAVNQVLARFKQIFPQAKMGTRPSGNGRKVIPVLIGVNFTDSIVNNEISTAISENSTPIPPQFPPQETLAQQDLHPNHPQFSNSVGVQNDQNVIADENAAQPNAIKEQVDNLGVVGVEPDTATLSAFPTEVEFGVEEPLIAVENGLLRIEDAITNAPLPQPQPPVKNGVRVSVSKRRDDEAPAVGDRVKIHCPGSKRDGKEGIVQEFVFKEGIKKAVVMVDGVDEKDRKFESLISWLSILPT